MASPATSVRAGAGLRLLRAAVFTAVCVVLAAAGHSMAVGHTVPVWSLALGWLAVFAVVAPLAGRERSLPGIAALLAVGQIALHAVFNAGQVCTTSTASGTSSGTAAADHGLMALAARLVCDGDGLRLTPRSAREVVVRAGLDPSAITMPTHAPGSGSGHAATDPMTAMATAPMCSLPMLLGHLLAAVVAGWLLRRGESALWRLVRLSVRGAAALSPATLSPAAAFRRARGLLSGLAARSPYAWLRVRCTAGGAAAGRYRTVWLRHCVARRGPPVVALAA